MFKIFKCGVVIDDDIVAKDKECIIFADNIINCFNILKKEYNIDENKDINNVHIEEVSAFEGTVIRLK